MQDLLEVVNHHAAAIGMRINASKTKVMATLIPNEQRQAVLFDSERLVEVDRFKYSGLMFIANGHCTKKTRSGIILSCLFCILTVVSFGKGPPEREIVYKR